MNVVVETATGGQVMPWDERNERATINGWQAFCATDADTRAKSPAHRDLASRLSVVMFP